MLGDHVLQCTSVPLRVNLTGAGLLQSRRRRSLDRRRLRSSASAAGARFAVARLTPASRARLATVSRPSDLDAFSRQAG